MLRLKYCVSVVAMLLLLISQSGTASSGGVLKAALIFGPDENLDPAYKYTGWYMREAGIYETLFSYDKDMKLIPELATGYDQISDTDYRIHLRENVKFHDGTPMNADAVIYSINRVVDPSNTRHNEYWFIDSIIKEDDYTIVLKTKKPFAPTIASLTDPLVSIVKPGENISINPIGTGPFKFESYQKGISLTVKRFDEYWGGLPKLDGAVIYYVGDPVTRGLQLEGKEVDIARGISPSDVGVIQKDPQLEVLNKETLRTYFLYVNTNKDPLSDLKVRHAINHAISREDIVNSVLEGIGGVAAKGVFPSILPWSVNDELEGYPFDPEKSIELLREAGIYDKDNDGWLDYNGKPFELTIKTYTKRPELKPSAELIAAHLQKIGIKTKVETLETGALSDDLKKGNYDLALYAWNTAPTGDPDYFLSKHFESSGTEAGYTGYSNKDVDSWIEMGRSTFDNKARMDYYSKVQKRILEESPEIFLFYLNELVGKNKKVKGYEIYPSEVTFLTKDVYIEE